MSYCRWGGGSRVYVFAHVNGTLCCCGCTLDVSDDWDEDSFYARSTREMVDHLAEHRRRGHSVPAIEDDLWSDDAENFPSPAEPSERASSSQQHAPPSPD